MFDLTLILKGLIVLIVALLVYKLFPVIKAAVSVAVLNVLRLVARFAVYAVESLPAEKARRSSTRPWIWSSARHLQSSVRQSRKCLTKRSKVKGQRPFHKPLT